MTSHQPIGREQIDDIPGTYVFTAERSRRGYQLNRFCMSLLQAANREAFRADQEAYLDRFPLTPEQRQAVLDRDYIRMLELGGNIYYTAKIGAADGLSFQKVASLQAGVEEAEYLAMMVGGGRPIEGNRSKAENEARATERRDG
jgi:protocatechuate 4,5-dioxygenase, alpha chain